MYIIIDEFGNPTKTKKLTKKIKKLYLASDLITILKVQEHIMYIIEIDIHEITYKEIPKPLSKFNIKVIKNE